MNCKVSPSHKGLTLIEVIMAMAIMSGVVFVIQKGMGSSIKRLSLSRQKITVTQLLQTKMLELESIYKEGKRKIPEQDSGDFGSDFKNYKYVFVAQELELPDLSSIALAAGGGTLNEDLAKFLESLTNYLKQSVMEVKLTVSYQRNATAEPLSYSLSTYFVDYDREMNIPLGI